MAILQGNGKNRTLRVSQAAEILCCSRSHVYELLQAQEIKGLRVGLGEKRGAVRVLADSVDEFISRRCIEFGAECLGLEIPSRVSAVSIVPVENFKTKKKNGRI